MNKLLIAIVAVFIVAIIIMVFISSRATPPKPYATISNQSFKLLVVKSGKDLEVGLSKYKSLPQNQGMLFIFSKPDTYGFWMRDMKFPIDIIFINGNKITQIYNNIPAPKSNNPSDLPVYKPKQASDKVLEINAGLSQKYGFKEGQEININL